MRTLMCLLCFAGAAMPDWGIKRGDGYKAWLTPYSNVLPATLTDVIPPPPADREDGAIVIIEPSEDPPDAYEVTLRYKTEGLALDGVVFSRTQVISSSWRGMFGTLFRVGRITPLSLSVRKVFYTSIRESQ